jgi:hypothetical protein
MMGLELVAGYLAAYAMQKARRVGRRVDDEVDRAIDEGLDLLHDVVTEKLGGDPAVAQLERDAVDGVASARTAERVRLAVEEAAETDQVFAGRLEEALARLEALDADRAAGTIASQFAVADRGSVVNQAGRDLTVRADPPR